MNTERPLYCAIKARDALRSLGMSNPELTGDYHAICDFIQSETRRLCPDLMSDYDKIESLRLSTPPAVTAIGMCAYDLYQTAIRIAIQRERHK